MVIHRLPLLISNSFLIETSGCLALVDAGFPGEARRILKRIHSVGSGRLTLIFITHAHLDHYGSAARLRMLTGASVAIHALDAEALANGETRLGSVRGRGRVLRRLFPLIQRFWQADPTPADLLLNDGDRLDEFGLPAQVIHTPGHTPGSACLWLEEPRLAFCGDLLTTSGRQAHIQRYFADDWAQIPRSVHRLKALRPVYAYPGHGVHPCDLDDLERLQGG